MNTRRLFEGLSENQANNYGLVLSAAGIEFKLNRAGGKWCLRVDHTDYENARNTISAYLAENKPDNQKERIPAEKHHKTLAGVWAALILLGIHVILATTTDDRIFIERYGASAKQILDGQLYRVATALLLHANSVHLAGNMVGIALFGTAVCSVAGWGVGWLIILISGVTGNLLNAAFYQAGHLSIGASTSVFGAIGFLAAHQFLRRYFIMGLRLRAWIPLGGGLALLGVLGASPFVDLAAHLFGFGSGIASGLFYGLLIKRTPVTRWQTACFLITAGVLTACWMAAMAK